MDRTSNREAGAARRRTLGQADDDPGLNAPGYHIGGRDILAPADRVIPALPALCFRGAGKATERMVGAALDAGLAPRAILELFIQSALYSGLPRTEEAIEIAHRVFAGRGIDLPGAPGDAPQPGGDGCRRCRGDGKPARGTPGRRIRLAR